MNLQVNLIIASEQRSASAFNLKAILRILSIVGPVSAVLAIALIVLHFVQTKLELDRLQTEWAIAKPRKEYADSLRNKASVNRQILEQLKGIAGSNLPWHRQLAGLIQVTPTDIQLQKLSLSQAIGKDAKGQPVRTFRMMLEGRASGVAPDQNVSDLKNRFLNEPVYASIVESANVVSFGLDTSANADKDDRAFRIDCKYLPRTFE